MKNRTMGKLPILFLLATIVGLSKCQACGSNYPRWPADFLWTYAGPRHGYHCVQIKEPADPHTWNDNFFCQRAGGSIQNIGMRWSYSGPINGMRCTRVIELSDPNTWRDNFLCVPRSSPFIFYWSMAGPIPGKHCIQWLEPADPHTWRDNYMCADIFPLPRLVYP